MARSIDASPAPRAVRGFVPARNEEERFLMRHIEDLARAAQTRGIARYSSFLSDREQALAQAALAELGYSSAEIGAALKGIETEGKSTEDIVKQCLRAMVMR